MKKFNEASLFCGQGLSNEKKKEMRSSSKRVKYLLLENGEKNHELH